MTIYNKFNKLNIDTMPLGLEQGDNENLYFAMAIGVIGSPGKFTPIAFDGSNQGKLRAVCSALYFEPVKTVGWEIIFHEKPCDDMTVKIL